MVILTPEIRTLLDAHDSRAILCLERWGNEDPLVRQGDPLSQVTSGGLRV